MWKIHQYQEDYLGIYSYSWRQIERWMKAAKGPKPEKQTRKRKVKCSKGQRRKKRKVLYMNDLMKELQELIQKKPEFFELKNIVEKYRL